MFTKFRAACLQNKNSTNSVSRTWTALFYWTLKSYDFVEILCIETELLTFIKLTTVPTKNEYFRYDASSTTTHKTTISLWDGSYHVGSASVLKLSSCTNDIDLSNFAQKRIIVWKWFQMFYRNLEMTADIEYFSRRGLIGTMCWVILHLKDLGSLFTTLYRN